MCSHSCQEQVYVSTSIIGVEIEVAELGVERSWGREEKGGGGKESGRVGVRGRRNGERLGKRSRIQRLFGEGPGWLREDLPELKIWKTRSEHCL